MMEKKASIELARLYETQGYYEDALSTYKLLDEEACGNSSEIRASVHRLERLCAAKGDGEKSKASDSGGSISRAFTFLNTDGPLADGDYRDDERNVAGLIEQWLTLMVVRKRLQLFKKIRSRL